MAGDRDTYEYAVQAQWNRLEFSKKYPFRPQVYLLLSISQFLYLIYNESLSNQAACLLRIYSSRVNCCNSVYLTWRYGKIFGVSSSIETFRGAELQIPFLRPPPAGTRLARTLSSFLRWIQGSTNTYVDRPQAIDTACPITALAILAAAAPSFVGRLPGSAVFIVIITEL